MLPKQFTTYLRPAEQIEKYVYEYNITNLLSLIIDNEYHSQLNSFENHNDGLLHDIGDLCNLTSSY